MSANTADPRNLSQELDEFQELTPGPQESSGCRPYLLPLYLLHYLVTSRDQWEVLGDGSVGKVLVTQV